MKLGHIPNTNKPYKVYVDMDGVIADFNHGVSELMPDEEHTDDRYENEPKYRKRLWQTINRHRKDGHELWYNLPLMHDAKVLWAYVNMLQGTEILSATGSEHGPNTSEQKVRWIREILGDTTVKINLVNRSSDKGNRFLQELPHRDKVAYILIDDKHKSIDPWIKLGGIGILHTSAEHTIKQLKSLGL